MALKDRIPFGMALPHRAPEPIDVAAVRQVATRAEALGFQDLWVTENTLDHVFCFDPVVVLQIHSPLMVAHQWACLDYNSNGRAIHALGIRRAHPNRQFELSSEPR